MRKSLRKETMERTRKKRKPTKAPENKLMRSAPENKSHDIVQVSGSEPAGFELGTTGCDDLSGSDCTEGSPSD